MPAGWKWDDSCFHAALAWKDRLCALVPTNEFIVGVAMFDAALLNQPAFRDVLIHQALQPELVLITDV